MQPSAVIVITLPLEHLTTDTNSFTVSVTVTLQGGGMCIGANVSGKDESAKRSPIVTDEHLAEDGIITDGVNDGRASIHARERAHDVVRGCNWRAMRHLVVNALPLERDGKYTTFFLKDFKSLILISDQYVNAALSAMELEVSPTAREMVVGQTDD